MITDPDDAKKEGTSIRLKKKTLQYFPFRQHSQVEQMVELDKNSAPYSDSQNQTSSVYTNAVDNEIKPSVVSNDMAQNQITSISKPVPSRESQSTPESLSATFAEPSREFPLLTPAPLALRTTESPGLPQISPTSSGPHSRFAKAPRSGMHQSPETASSVKRSPRSPADSIRSLSPNARRYHSARKEKSSRLVKKSRTRRSPKPSRKKMGLGSKISKIFTSSTPQDHRKSPGHKKRLSVSGYKTCAPGVSAGGSAQTSRSQSSIYETNERDRKTDDEEYDEIYYTNYIPASRAHDIFCRHVSLMNGYDHESDGDLNLRTLPDCRNELHIVEGEERYFLGIIDFFTQYTLKKKLENFYKRIIYPPLSFSTVPPPIYADRFFRYWVNNTT